MKLSFGRFAAFAMLAAVGCSSGSDDGTGGGNGDSAGTIVPPGKADNYYSTNAREYTVTGSTYATIDATCLSRHASEPDPQKVCSLESITLKNFSIAWFLNQYVINKHEAANQDWGGFTAMTRPASYETLEVSAPDANGKFSYRFTSELSGPLDLLTQIPTQACGENKCFTLEVPVLPNSTLSKLDTGSEWYRKAPFNAYDPGTYSGEKETLELTIKPYPRSNDAYFEYQKLFSPDQLAKAGNALRIGIFVGWDYNSERFDLQTAKELYRWLTEDEGFTSPVANFDALKIDSGDFQKTIKVNGKDVVVRVLLVHPGQGDPTNETFAGQMKSALIQAFGERQIVIYEGHAGPLYGFSLSDWNLTSTGELDDTELPGLSIPENFYQVVLASGCDTYMVADSLYQNPVKQGRLDLDVITTTSFSNAAGQGRTSKVLLDAVLNQDAGGQLQPKMYGEILRNLNNEWWMTPLFGVHGIDDNPRVNPFADFSKLCEPCTTATECGGYDSQCVDYGSGQKHCGTKCESNNDCPDGYGCFDIRFGDTITTKVCAPSTMTCGAAPPPPPAIWINEIHYDNTGADTGEGVELAGTAGMDLTGYSLVMYNGKAGQLRSYQSVSLEGAMPSQQGGFGVLWTPVIGLQNGGADGANEPDGIALVDAQGKVVQFLSYEGSFTPTNGPAMGLSSTDIGVSQLSTTAVGTSLSLAGSGSAYASFSWNASAVASPGQPNPGQTFQ
jgi:hypothetical protein